MPVASRPSRLRWLPLAAACLLAGCGAIDRTRPATSRDLPSLWVSYHDERYDDSALEGAYSTHHAYLFDGAGSYRFFSGFKPLDMDALPSLIRQRGIGATYRVTSPGRLRLDSPPVQALINGRVVTNPPHYWQADIVVAHTPARAGRPAAYAGDLRLLLRKDDGTPYLRRHLRRHPQDPGGPATER